MRLGPIAALGLASTSAFVLASACGGSDEAKVDGAPSPTSTGTSTAGPEGGPPPEGGPITPSSTCTGKPAASGDQDWTIDAGGLKRIAHVHVPKSYDPGKAIPVVLNFHGYSSNADQQILLSHMNEKADATGFVAVHAEGTGTPQSWNAGLCCGQAVQNMVDDVGFVKKILDELDAKLCIDKKRIFATGMSNGGFLSHRLACELSDRIAAVAPVAGVNGLSSCTPTRPMSVHHFHGTADTVIPYNGGGATNAPGVIATMDGWAKRSNCRLPARQTTKRGDVTCVTYDGCDAGAEVSLCTIDQGGHTWPGGTPVPPLGKTSTDIKATDEMWDFFTRHPLP